MTKNMIVNRYDNNNKKKLYVLTTTLQKSHHTVRQQLKWYLLVIWSFLERYNLLHLEIKSNDLKFFTNFIK